MHNVFIMKECNQRI